MSLKLSQGQPAVLRSQLKNPFNPPFIFCQPFCTPTWQVMPPLDPEMAQAVSAVLASKGVKVVLGDGVAGFEQVRMWGVPLHTCGAKCMPYHFCIGIEGCRQRGLEPPHLLSDCDN
jgi:hypothetical protein